MYLRVPSPWLADESPPSRLHHSTCHSDCPKNAKNLGIVGQYPAASEVLRRSALQNDAVWEPAAARCRMMGQALTSYLFRCILAPVHVSPIEWDF